MPRITPFLSAEEENFISYRPLNPISVPMTHWNTAFTIGFLLLAASPARSDVSYLIDTAAGSDLVGDDGPAVAAQLINAHGRSTGKATYMWPIRTTTGSGK
jgi:hypothetical protein